MNLKIGDTVRYIPDDNIVGWNDRIENWVVAFIEIKNDMVFISDATKKNQCSFSIDGFINNMLEKVNDAN